MASLTIIGTSHIAKQSVNQIKQSIKELNPDIVAIELDTERARRIFEKPEAPKLSNIFSMGFTAFTLGFIGWSIQQKLGSKVGLAAGSDMKTAMIEANKSGAKLYLIDQPIQKTMYNMSTKMTRWEKIKLFFYLFAVFLIPFKGGEKIDLSKVPEEEFIEDSMLKIKKHFPGIYTALITDRNKYMTRQLKYLIEKNPESKVLAVVGAGHKKAILKSFIQPARAG